MQIKNLMVKQILHDMFWDRIEKLRANQRVLVSVVYCFTRPVFWLRM